MATNFPTGIDNFPTHTDNNNEKVNAAHLNNVQDAVIAIENEFNNLETTVLNNVDIQLQNSLINRLYGLEW